MFVFIKKVFHIGSLFLSSLASTKQERRLIKWHETCKCKCTLDAGVCNNKQRWNDDKCRC